MLARKKLSSRKVMILTGTIVLVWLVIGILVYYNFNNKKVVVPVGINNSVGLPAINNPSVGQIPAGGSNGTTIKTDLFSSPAFQQLKIYGEIPLKVKTLGRTNPFEPPANFNLTSNK